MTEALDVSGISGILGHRIALWYEADIPQADLFTPHDTVRNYIDAFGGPMPLTVDGVEGFYHITAAVEPS